jgi:hypothetical protein
MCLRSWAAWTLTWLVKTWDGFLLCLGWVVSKWVLLVCGSVTVRLHDAIEASSLRRRVRYLFTRLVKAHVVPLLSTSQTKVQPSLLLASMSYFPPYLRVATISLLNLPALLFRWTRGVESRFLAWSWRWLLGRPLHRSMPVRAHATHSFSVAAMYVSPDPWVIM